MLDLHRLRLLRELEALGTIAATAGALGYTPSAVSQQLAVLEREAGVKLLVRAGRGVRLTDAGRVLAAHATTLLAAAEEAEAELAQRAPAIGGTVRVAAFQTAMLQLVIPAVAALAVAHPQIRVEVVEAEVEKALPALRRQRIDLLIADEYDGLPRERHADLRRARLLREQVRLVLPADHPLARRQRSPPLADLSRAVWSSAQVGTGHHAMVRNACRSLGGFEPDLRHASNDLLILLELVRATGTIALLPDLVHTTSDDSVAVRTPAEGAIHREVHALTRRTGTTRPALAAVSDELRAQATRAAPPHDGRAPPAR